MSNTNDKPQISQVLKVLPDYAETADDAYLISRQDRLTNRVFRIDHPKLEPVVVRFAGEGTGDYIDRPVEFQKIWIVD